MCTERKRGGRKAAWQYRYRAMLGNSVAALTRGDDLNAMIARVSRMSFSGDRRVRIYDTVDGLHIFTIVRSAK